jgi:HPt (histidine-containing phosphotransfer) domain-containing protein
MTANERRATHEAAHLDTAAALDRLDGMAELYVALIHEFLPELDTVGAQFQALLRAGTQADATRLVHSLKGSSATLGATGLAEMAAVLEQLCKAGDTGAALARCAELDDMLASTRVAYLTALPDLERAPGQEPS